MKRTLFAITLAALIAPPALALIVQGTPMPVPTNYVGWWRGATGVAIGPHHIITARHLQGSVGEGFSLDGGQTFYESVAITQHPTADVAIIQVKGTLPGWHPIATTIKKGNAVTLAGLGKTAGATTRTGVTWSDQRDERWGKNKVDSVRDGLITIRFNKVAGNKKYEATFAMGDSGAAVFTTVRGQLQLAGVAYGTEGAGHSNWNSRGYATDITPLRSWIQSVVEAP